ncbi:hypothetical protein [Mastigocoleus testarum]|uniref:hypothetical protein n=1 Tax=Mastigocoleus testarum TaxID=996925 RepID=UPI0007C84AF6|nr:hypothetical protein [Mastigocoleus testarum]
MAFVFLIPLVMTLVALYFFTKFRDELRYLSGSIAGICFAVSVSLAPWEALLLFLIPALVITGKGIQKGDYKFHLQSIQKENERKNKKKRKKRR